MRKLFLISGFAVIAGCTGERSDLSISEPLAYQAEIAVYIRCNERASARLARQEGDVASLGVAAQAMCGPSMADLADAMARANGVSFALDASRRIERDQARRNAGLIAKFRADS